jgi:hypothetical protein
MLNCYSGFFIRDKGNLRTTWRKCYAGTNRIFQICWASTGFSQKLLGNLNFFIVVIQKNSTRTACCAYNWPKMKDFETKARGDTKYLLEWMNSERADIVIGLIQNKLML